MKSGTITIRVQMLDNSVHMYDVKLKSLAGVLLQAVLKDLNLFESDYFGILYRDSEGIETFLDPIKRLNVQIPSTNNMVLKFVVKFFPPDPGQLQEEYTRYLFALQLKLDIVQDLLFCSDNALAKMTSYIVQSEFGDWNARECSNLLYLKDLKILPDKYEGSDIYRKISELHKANMGQSSADADLRLLNTARHVETFGLRLHPAVDEEDGDVNLAVTHTGVLVMQGNTKLNTFTWAQIRKLSFRKKRFFVKLKAEIHSDNRRSTGDIVVLTMTSRDACKAFWRRCIEHHTFFRMESRPEVKPQPVLLKRGSTFTYRGKTQKQLHDLVATSNFRRSSFVRTSRRKSSSARIPNTSWSNPPTHNGYEEVGSNRVEVDVKMQISSDVSPVRENEAPPRASGDDVAMTSSAANGSLMKSWQVESGKLHSGSDTVATKQTKRNEEEYNPSSIGSCNGKGESPVHLHSGGVYCPSPIKDQDRSPLPTNPVTSLQSQAALLSTRDLKPTSSMVELQTSSAQVYFVAKETLTTERSYIKDLQVISKWFQSTVDEEGIYLPPNLSNALFGETDALLDVHQSFLQQLEDRFSVWEERGFPESLSYHQFDNLMLRHMTTLNKHIERIEDGESLIVELEELATSDGMFEKMYREFELQKVCYLPFSAFILKPMQRMIHYKILIDNMLSHHTTDETSDLEKALHEVDSAVSAVQGRLKRAFNIQKMAQLRRDLIGVDFLFEPGRRNFIREGSLYKLSRRGFQQRLFFLFSDCLLYTSKGVTGTNQFKVRSDLPLRGMVIEINEGDSVVPNCFSLIVDGKTVIVAAATVEEMQKWLEDLDSAIKRAEEDASQYKSPMMTSRRDSVNRCSIGASSDEGSVRDSIEGLKAPIQHRSNATMHVCWHRNTSVSADDHITSLKNQLSGYLLRKFKNSNGWQKLWVVFSNFCLFFYKSCQDDHPLASLPLLGYSINIPDDKDKIKREFVFKLQFKTHVYFFRAESRYTFNRWIQAVSSAIVTSPRTNLLSEVDINQ